MAMASFPRWASAARSEAACVLELFAAPKLTPKNGTQNGGHFWGSVLGPETVPEHCGGTRFVVQFLDLKVAPILGAPSLVYGVLDCFKAVQWLAHVFGPTMMFHSMFQDDTVQVLL